MAEFEPLKTPALLMAHPKGLQHRLAQPLWDCLAHEFDLQTLVSPGPGQTIGLIRQALANFQGVVFSAGGDGTFHEILNGWAQAGFPSGIDFVPLPMGTGNDFLYSIDKRYRNLQTYLEHPLTRKIRADLGHIQYQTEHGSGHRYFCVGATTGFSAQVTATRDWIGRWIPGRMAYWLAILVAVGRWSRWPVTVTRTGQPGWVRQFPHLLNFNCSNVKFYGGGLVSSPLAEAQSKKLQAVAMSMGFWGFLKALPECYWGRFDGVQELEQWAVQQEHRLTSQAPLPVQADGELLGTTPITFQVLAASLPLLLPALPATS